MLFSTEFLKDKTLAIIKPDATSQGKALNIEKEIQYMGFTVWVRQEVQLSREAAEEFYEEHKGQPFFEDLVTFMSSGPCVFLVLELPESPENSVLEFRRVLGSTDPEKASEGTLRALFATSKSRNAVHGSDSEKSATREIEFLGKLLK